ncbi:MAG: AAA family ATPase [Bacilli bacterium]|nr:AAA family ATPase [Bacilli bacterium]
MTRIIAIANQKGGVGKTTTSINLSAALAHLKRNVLLVDMDPQGNAGRGLGIDISLLEHTVYDALMGTKNAKDVIQKTDIEGLSALPANLRLASLEASLYKEPVEEPFALLGKALEPVLGSYDYVIIDCPPSLGLLSINAMACANSVLIPVQCEYFAMEALAAILSSISNIQNQWNPKLRIEGFLLTMYDARTQLGTEIASEVRRLFKENTFLVSIPRNQSVSESQARQMPVTSFRPTSQGAVAYFSLAREVIDHEEK